VSGRGRRLAPELPGRLRHPIIVRDDPSKFRSELLRSGEVDGVQGTELGRLVARVPAGPSVPCGAMSSPAADERAALCDLFEHVGPDAPTLAGDWTTRDLAAHLVVRERRPDAAAGLLVPMLAGYGEHVRLAEAERPWAELVERVRRGPGVLSPTRVDAVDRAVNSVEFFVHHEDVRRATDGWTVRAIPDDLGDALAAVVAHLGRRLVRGGVGVRLLPDGREALTLRAGDPPVSISGPIGECVLYGRKDVARVTLDGPADAVADVAAAAFGL